MSYKVEVISIDVIEIMLILLSRNRFIDAMYRLFAHQGHMRSGLSKFEMMD